MSPVQMPLVLCVRSRSGKVKISNWSWIFSLREKSTQVWTEHNVGLLPHTIEPRSTKMKKGDFFSVTPRLTWKYWQNKTTLHAAKSCLFWEMLKINSSSVHVLGTASTALAKRREKNWESWQGALNWKTTQRLRLGSQCDGCVQLTIHTLSAQSSPILFELFCPPNTNYSAQFKTHAPPDISDHGWSEFPDFSKSDQNHTPISHVLSAQNLLDFKEF